MSDQCRKTVGWWIFQREVDDHDWHVLERITQCDVNRRADIRVNGHYVGIVVPNQPDSRSVETRVCLLCGVVEDGIEDAIQSQVAMIELERSRVKQAQEILDRSKAAPQ